jgi:hypothetical protein
MKRGWRNRAATKAQRRIVYGLAIERQGRITQADILKAMLRRANAEDRALRLPEIMQAGIAQFTARIFELRERGFKIENELRRTPDGQIHSLYWLRFEPENGGVNG